MGGGGGGGYWLFEGRYPLPNYQTRFSKLSAPKFSLTAPYFEGHRKVLSKIRHCIQDYL